MTIRHVEEDLDPDLDPGAFQVIQGDLVHLLTGDGALTVQLQDAVTKFGQSGQGVCRKAR